MSRFSIRYWQSQTVLKTSPMASGVVVCWRTNRSASWSSAGVTSSSQNRRYGSRAFSQLGGLRRGQPVVGVVQQLDVRADVLTDRLDHPRCVLDVGLRVEALLGGPAGSPGRLVARVLGDAVHLFQAGHAGLHAD